MTERTAQINHPTSVTEILLSSLYRRGHFQQTFRGFHSSNPVAKCIAHGGFSIYISDLYALCPKKGQTPTINAWCSLGQNALPPFSQGAPHTKLVTSTELVNLVAPGNHLDSWGKWRFAYISGDGRSWCLRGVGVHNEEQQHIPEPRHLARSKVLEVSQAGRAVPPGGLSLDEWL